MSVTVDKLNGYDKTISCPPDKSISVRAVIFNSYAAGSSVVNNISLCDDVLSAVECMRRLGAKIDIIGSTAHIVGTGGRFVSGTIDCGNSGTTARILIGLLSGVDGEFTVTGDGSLSARPMKRITEPLKLMGADIELYGDGLPVRVRGKRLTAVCHKLDIPSAQVKSALIAAALNADGVTEITECENTRNHTEIMLKNMGVDIRSVGNKISVSGGALKACDITVTGDMSAAAYPMCLALCVPNGKCKIKGVGLNATRRAVLDVLLNSGANITVDNVKDGAEPMGDITVINDRKIKLRCPSSSLSALIDEIPVLCALACHSQGKSVVPMPNELKYKETDRISNIVSMLKSLGVGVTLENDGAVIEGAHVCFGRVNACGDHRIAMAAAVAAAAGEGCVIEDGECVSVSFPDFFSEVL